MSAICPACKQSIRVGVPKRGDGTALQMWRHKWRGQTCEGSFGCVKFSEINQPEEGR